MRNYSFKPYPIIKIEDSTQTETKHLPQLSAVLKRKIKATTFGFKNDAVFSDLNEETIL